MKSKIILLMLLIACSFSVKAQWAIDNFMPYLENGQYDEYISKAKESTDTLKGHIKRNVRQTITLFEMITEKSNTQLAISNFDDIVALLKLPIKMDTIESGLKFGSMQIGENYYWFLHNSNPEYNRIVNLEGKFRTVKGIEYNNIRAGVSNLSAKMVAKTNYPFEYEVVYYKENKAMR